MSLRADAPNVRAESGSEDRRGPNLERVSTEVHPPPPFFSPDSPLSSVDFPTRVARFPLFRPALVALLLISLLALAAHLAPAQTDTAHAQEPSGEGPDEEDGGGASAQSGAVGAALGDAADASLSGGPSDLSVTIEGYELGSPIKYIIWVIWAENHGGRDVHGAQVLVDRKNPITGKVYYKFEGKRESDYEDIPGDVLSFSLLDYVALDSSTGVWRIGSLPAGSKKGMVIGPKYEASGGNVPDTTTGASHPGRVVAPLSAEIHNPRHRDPNPENNSDTTGMVIKKTDLNFAVLSAFNTLLEAKAGDLRPANNDGQAVDFTLKMENAGQVGLVTRGATHTLLSDVKLDVTLSGLKVKTAPTTTELNGTTIKCKDSGKDNDTLGACAEGDDYAEWDAGFLYSYGSEDCASTSTTGEYDCRQLTLKLALDGDMPLEERCLEARIRSLPAPEGWLGGPVKACLGADDPTRLLLEDGQIDLFTLYPCVGTGRDAYPCDSDDTDSLEVVAGAYLPTDFTRRSDILGDPTGAVHVRNRNSGKALFQASDNDLFIQVKDPDGRYFDGQTTDGGIGIGSSVNGGQVISWHTARNPFYSSKSTHTNYRYNTDANLPGVHLAFTAAPFSDERADWDKVAFLTGVGGLENDGSLPPALPANTCADPATSTISLALPTLPLAPGDARKRQMWSGRADADYKTNYVNYPWYKYPNLTYLTVTRNIRPYDRFFEFEKLGTYVLYYHVSGNRSSGATYKPGQTFCDTARYVFHAGPVADLALRENAGQSGYSVSAMNNGPDPAEWAEVKLNVTNATNASVTRGCFDPSTGVWGLSQKWNSTTSACEDLPRKRLPGDADPRFHPGDEATLTFSSGSGSVNAQIYNRERCVNAAGVVQSTSTTEIACIYTSATTTRTGNHWGSYEVCVDYDSANKERAADAIRVVNNTRLPIENENHCTDSTKGGASDNTWDVGTVYDHDELNNNVTMGRGPGAVGNLRASRDASDETVINISWNAPGGSPAPTGYDVEYQSRAANSGPWGDWIREATDITGTTTYAFANAGGGTGYRFRVRSVTASNPDDLTSSWRVSSTVGTVSNPDQVRNLRATRDATDLTLISVSWQAPSGGTTPSSYELEYSESGGAWTTAPNRTDTATTTYQLANAKGLSHYQFRARAVTITGGDTIYGSWRSSNAVSRVPNPGQVRNLSAARVFTDDTKIDVSWEAPSGGTTPTIYEMSYQVDGGAWSVATTTQATSTHQFSPASGNSRYVFRVRGVTTLSATSERIEGSWRSSNTVSKVAAPRQVGNLRAERRFADETTIDVTWTAPSNANSRTSYEVEYQQDGAAWTSARTGLDTTTYEFPSAAGQSRYVFRVRGVTTLSGGERLEGSWRSSNTVQRVPTPGQVGNLRATRHATDDTIIKVSWTAPSNATGATRYDVDYKADSASDWTSEATGLNTTTHPFTSANGASRYVFRVRAVTVSDGSDLTGSWRGSNAVPVLPAPNRVSNVNATRDPANENRVTVTWTAPTSGTTPTGYEVQYKENNAGDWKPDTPTDVPGTTTAVFSDAAIIKGGSRYQFQVRAYTTLNSGTKLRGGWRSSNNVAGLPAGNISTTTATRDGHDPTKINIVWTDSARATVGYQVQRRENNGGWKNATTTGPSARSYTQPGVGGVQTHTFRVRGISGAGNGAWTESSAVQPPPVGNHGYDVGVDWFTIKVTSGPWWYDYRNHVGDWSSCIRVASGGKTLTGLRPQTTYLVDVYKEAGCSSGHMGRHSIYTLSDWNNPYDCWNTDDCRNIDNPNDMNNHTHKRSRLAKLGENRSDCAYVRVFHNHGWPDGGGGQHWHCPY